MKLVVGLGNPGRRYVHTRHNVGFMVVDELLKQAPQSAKQEKFAGWFSMVLIDDRQVGFLQPTTSMNLSGLAVAQAVGFYKLPLEDLLVVTDDLALPSARLRLRRNGSPGGHNGLASITEYMNTTNFARLRIGIGPSSFPSAVDFVLADFTDAEWLDMVRAIELAAQAVRCWIVDGLDAAMNSFNRPQDRPDEPNSN